MKYNFREDYHNSSKYIYDNKNTKRGQEMVIVETIMHLLNNNKYDNLEEFIAKNSKYQDFLKNNNLQTAMKHFGNTLKEDDYIKILENLRKLTKDKLTNNKEAVKTTNIEDKQFNTYEGQDKTYFIDNSNSDKTIEKQMDDIQLENSHMQTPDAQRNTESIFKELEKKKETLNLEYLHSINFDSLSNEEKELYMIAEDYDKNVDGTTKVDLKRGLIVNEMNEILKIKKENGEFSIIKENSDEEKVTEVQAQQKSFQKTLTPSRNTIYNN